MTSNNSCFCFFESVFFLKTRILSNKKTTKKPIIFTFATNYFDISIRMKNSFIKLHLSIILAGFTGILGRLISLNELPLVFYRMSFTFIVLLIYLWMTRHLQLVSGKNLLKICSIGGLMALHWIFFYGSIKVSNVSIAVICFSLIGFFTAFLEPLFNHTKFSFKELFFSMITLVGILLIFHFDARYRLGIVYGIISSALASVFTILNRKQGQKHNATTLLLYEMLGGVMLISLIIPFYIGFNQEPNYIPTFYDVIYLFILAVVCTIVQCILQIQALQKISAFTVNLSYNLEPIYSIILAMIIFDEAKELSSSFYIGFLLIIISVLLQTFNVFKNHPIKSSD